MTEETPTPSNNTMSYILGGVLVVAVIAGGYFLRPKSTTPQTGGQPTQTAAETPTPTLGPISGLACDSQYYNPVIGFAKYYLSVAGSDTKGASEVTCTTKVTQENKLVATEEVSVPLTSDETRGGLEFRCSTPALELKPTIPTKVDVTLKDDKGATTSCSRVFALPKP